ncbi:sodium:solute symporter [Pseudopedobacter sp.]|uniref:sodium:solute symporter n=1 Tax=Pseudopedobacter sp. TaxID=1936787 RepID=UPI0033422716
MKNLPFLDLAVIALYLIAMVLVGVYFSRKNDSSDHYSKASGRIPGWAIGLSIYATFLSSNTFLGVPGKAFGGNWNAFVFSLSMPLAAWVAAKYFVPFYRTVGEVSAYTNLEKRFGAWARTYAVICFLLTQLARMGSIFFGISLTLQALTGYSMEMIMLVTGICIIIYTVMGGIEAVIWTEVVQGILKTLGAVLIIYLIVADLPGGFSKIIEIGKAENKFSLGSLSLDFTQSTFWVILLYGFFINLNNFGMDQNYVQRYHTARSAKEAAKSVWLCVYCYVPASLLFFVIGTCLYAYYQLNPELIEPVKLQAAAERLSASASSSEIASLAATLKPEDYGDKVMPHFMVTMIPTGLVGLIVSAILSAAMSTISSGMNASATVFAEDIYKRYFRPNITDKHNMRLLHLGTVAFGLAGMVCGIAMIGVKSILDIWWQLSGIFAGGMLGLFLLGLISKRSGNTEALAATIVGLMVILWMSLSYLIPDEYSYLRNPLHANMIIVVGTLTIYLVGAIMTKFRNASNNS